jgi:selenide,water dikinase
MSASNEPASRVFLEYEATACTDVTGFGLLGHLREILLASHTDAEVELDSVPVLDGAIQTAAAGHLSSLHAQNVRTACAIVDPPESHPAYLLLFDPQTAGGLLAAVPKGRIDASLRALEAVGCRGTPIGRITAPEGAGGAVRLL